MRLATLERVFAALRDGDVRYLVVGGVAVNAHGYQRLTVDVNLVVELRAENVRAAFRALAPLGYRPSAPVTAEQFADAATRRGWIEAKGMTVLNLQSDALPDVPLDLFAEEPFDFEREYREAMRGELAPGREVRFVRIPTLIEMKRRAGRARDLDDIEHLELIQEEHGHRG
jgi:hypothetical protein